MPPERVEDVASSPPTADEAAPGHIDAISATQKTSFRTEARRQSLVVATSIHEAEDQAFIDAISDRDDE